MSRVIAIGDIHGCDVALETLLDAIDPRPEDLIITLGDIVDRGPNSRRSLDLLIDLRDRCQYIGILGNHEEMMLSYWWMVNLRIAGCNLVVLPLSTRMTLQAM